ncbi:DNA-binding protein [Lachnoclostridium edouardi]|uniref:DNA-binding protein n=1 Tax=Lachnoclostridium edouardi TaxID=1926283 RepID=UPI001FA88EF9|nr:DNA-binding protein [Lachnoclostridium edouardi]
MSANEENGVGIDQQVYLAADIQRMLGIGKSKSYMFLEEVYKQKNPPFKVLKIGKLFRVPKRGFDDWLNGGL